MTDAEKDRLNAEIAALLIREGLVAYVFEEEGGLLALVTRYHEALREAVMAQQVWTVEQAEAWINHQIWEREE